MSDVFLGDLPLWSNADAEAVLKELCAKHSVPFSVLEQLVGMQRERAGEERARNVYPRIEEILSEMD